MATDIHFIDDGGGRLVLEGGDHLVLEGRAIELRGRLRLSVVQAAGDSLPVDGQLGDVVIQLRERETLTGRFTESSIWVCLPPDSPSVAGPTYWRQIQLGPAEGVF